jgi:hypothetical protein
MQPVARYFNNCSMALLSYLTANNPAQHLSLTGLPPTRFLNVQITAIILFQAVLSVITGVAAWAWRENSGKLRPHLALSDPVGGGGGGGGKVLSDGVKHAIWLGLS